MRSVLVLGLGKSGIAAASRVLAQGDDLTVYAGKRNDAAEDVAARLADAGAKVVFDSEDVQGDYDLCIVSPGIPQTGAFYQSAAKASTQIMSEPEFAWRLSPEAWIAVTGTNGKTTTTSLVTHVLNACGMTAHACGNIGNTCIEAIEECDEGDTLVAEMSSYQLASTLDFSPKVSVLLNITPDHLSWHGGFEPYAQAKFKVFDNMGEGCTAVIGQSVLDAYPDLAQRILSLGARLVRIGCADDAPCAFMDEDGILVIIDEDGNRLELVNCDELQIKGSHNVENALAASVAALGYGCDIAGVREGLRSFAPLEHRIEPCGVIDDVGFFNDSKATNVDATLKALTAFPRQQIVLLLGGRDKGTDLSELVGACIDTCSDVIVYGEAGPRFAEAFAGSITRCHERPGMRQAFQLACEIAQPGQVVLLSPACASFDEFDSFEHRGEVFKELVAQAKKDRA